MASIKVAVVENADEERINAKLKELGLTDRDLSIDQKYYGLSAFNKLRSELISIQVIVPPVLLFAPDGLKKEEIDATWEDLKRALKDATRAFITYIA